MAAPLSRLAYIDWLRGLACLLMFQTHCYDAWLGGAVRQSTFFMWSQLGGTFPAPLFLFLAGISFALVTDKLLQKGLAPLLWTTWRLRFLPWEIETYINGVHNLGTPQAWLFPVFPWTAFASAGLVFGFLILSDAARKLGAKAFLLAGVAGLVLIYGAK